MMESDCRAAKILSNLKTAFQKDPDIDEYDILPVSEPAHNCNPLVLTEHKLGLEAWAVRLMFLHSYNNLLASRGTNNRNPKPESCDLSEWSRAVLLVNADCATAWNIRKTLIMQADLKAREDLKLGALILTKHPKSSETFAQRKWLINHIILQENLIPSQQRGLKGSVEGSGSASCVPSDMSVELRTLATSELQVCTAAAERYANNYYAWCHRIWVMDTLAVSADKLLLEAELQVLHDWVNRHVSDHSGFHYRQYLLKCLQHHADEPATHSTLLKKELALTADLILSYPGHEATWCHRRYVISCLVRDRLEGAVTANNQTDNHTCKRMRCDHTDSVLEQEASFCMEAQESSKLEWQHTLIQRHKHWLDNVLVPKV